MKTLKVLVKLAAAAAAIAGIAYLVVKYMDKITEWLNKVCPACPFCSDGAVAEEEAEAPAEECQTIDETVEITPSENAVTESPITEDVPEAVPVSEGEPVAEAEDFEA